MTEHLGSFKYFVDGEKQPSTEQRKVTNPATNETLALVANAGPEGVNTAIQAAQSAQTEWQRHDSVERKRILNTIADLIRDHMESLVEVSTLETGRPLSESRIQISGTAKTFEYYAGLADKIEGRQIPIPGETERLDYTLREPYGVTAHVVPWNAPVALAARSFAPALAAGNTVVSKAPPKAPISLLKLAELAHDAGLPDGVLNVVTGDGKTTGDALVSDDRVRAVEFTGSVATGTQIMKRAAERIAPVHLELGGKSANIVFPDANIDQAVQSVVDTFYNAGQVCFAPTRVFVHESIYESFVERAVEQVEQMTVGPGIDDPDMGPLITESARESVASYVDSAVEDGGRLLTGGTVPREEGNFYAPTLIDSVDDDASISCEEVFGPVLTLYSFQTAKEVVRRANDTKYGLNNVVWTNDLSRAHTVARGLESGTVQINEYPALSPAAVSGGYKQSGLGRSKGQQAIESFTQSKNIIVSLGSMD